MYPYIRPWLFKLAPERAHALTLNLIHMVGAVPFLRGLFRRIYSSPEKPVEVLDLRFKNPVGLAAGYDKDGIGWRGLAALGFGHIEIGTVTRNPQPGNPRPRLFRLVEDRALVNRMGFPGRGAEFVMRQLLGPRPKDLVIGVNIGKNKDTPLEEASTEYSSLVSLFAPVADYLAINVSSPNTAGLRDLQASRALENLLTQVSHARQEAAMGSGKKIPMLVKLAPDLEKSAIDQALAVIVATGIDGIIATNTTLMREGLVSPFSKESGGLSGAPLFSRSLEVVQHIVQSTSGLLPVIAVGGIMNGQNARAMLDAGASLVQIYTGLVYAGPGLVQGILSELD
jgi:dihydroorotate dehydrogenase